MTTIAEIHARGARCFPNHSALIHEGGSLTFRALYESACGLAGKLLTGGLQPGDRVAVLARNGPVQILGFAACEVSGLVGVAVNWRLAPPEIAYILEDSGVSCLVFESEFAATVDAIRNGLAADIRLICPDGGPDWAENLEDLARPGAVPLPPKPNDLAYLIYTSGTTGRPKGVMLDHASQVALAEEVVTAGGVRQDDSALLVMPLFHIGAKSKQLGYAIAGATCFTLRQFDARLSLDIIAECRITGVHLAPIMVQMILDEQTANPVDLSSLQAVYYASAPMPVPVLRRAMDTFGPVLIQFYGMTETGVSTVLQAHQHVIEGSPEEVARLGSAGQATFRSRVRIVRTDGRVASPGEAGEVWLGGPTIMRGYWRQPEATASTLVEGWVRSGDVGRLDDEEFLTIVDRMKDVIITGGENVYPREVEEALLQHPSVDQAAVIGVPDARWGEAVCAIVVARAAEQSDADELIAYCRTRIASYKKPRHIHYVTELPRLANGKVDKKALRASIETFAQ